MKNAVSLAAFSCNLSHSFVTKKSKMKNYHIKTKREKDRKKQKGRKKESLILNLNKTLSLTLC